MRLLLNEEWFDAVSSEGQYESEFQDIIIGRADSLFPDYYVVSFNALVESEDGRRRPDLALIDRNYRYWWVVEVEMAHHSLYGHVIPQVEVFARGKYGQEHCDHLISRCNELNPVDLADMIKGAQPRVVVLVNRSVPDWIEPIHGLDGIVTIVEVFRSGRNQHILRIDGEYPTRSAVNVLSMCNLDNTMARLLQIDSPAALGVGSGDQISIRFQGGITIWSRLDSADKVWLIPSGRNPLSANQSYRILKDADGGMSFEEA